ncbi:hypothetical protein PAMP_001356 [Pampus punctatissimus]
MCSGSVHLTRAVRLAACGKEPEEKLSVRRQQTADESDLFIFVKKNRMSKGENRDGKKQTENKEKDKEIDNQQFLSTLLKKGKDQKRKRNEDKRVLTKMVIKKKKKRQLVRGKSPDMKSANRKKNTFELQKRKPEWRDN